MGCSNRGREALMEAQRFQDDFDGISADGHSMSEMMALPALQSVLLPGGKQNITSMRDFPLNQQNFAAVAQLAPLYNATNTNLRRYMEHGGKLIMWR